MTAPPWIPAFAGMTTGRRNLSPRKNCVTSVIQDCYMPSPVAECWWRPFRTVGHAAVLHVDLTAHADREAEAWAWLDEEEQGRWQRYQHDGSRRRFALCRAALRAVLCSQLDCRNEQLAFGASDRGKPYAVVQGQPAPVSFNVSHSGAHGLIAVAATGRLGSGCGGTQDAAPSRWTHQ